MDSLKKAQFNTKQPKYNATFSQATDHLLKGGIVTLADIHLGAPHQISKHSEVLKLLQLGAYGLGDVIDFANLERKDADLWLARYEQYIKYLYVDGNHDIFTRGNDYLIKENKGFTHSHLIFWNYKKIKKWQEKKIGKVWWRFLVYSIKHLRNKKLKKLWLSEKEWKKIHDYCDFINVTELYIGHTHRYLEQEHTLNGRTIKLHACPRGFTLHY